MKGIGKFIGDSVGFDFVNFFSDKYPYCNKTALGVIVVGIPDVDTPCSNNVLVADRADYDRIVRAAKAINKACAEE